MPVTYLESEGGMPIVTLPETCVGCGGCCWLIVEIRPEDRVPDEMTVPIKVPEDADKLKATRAMAVEEDGFCVAMDRKTGLCKIYETRPMTCREFTRGCKGCFEAIFRTRFGNMAGVCPGTTKTPEPLYSNVQLVEPKREG